MLIAHEKCPQVASSLYHSLLDITLQHIAKAAWKYIGINKCIKIFLS